MSERLPMLVYLREILDEHTLPLDDMNAGMIEAVWLVYLINQVERVYKSNGS
jgi:hypothetical protein